MAAYSVIIIDDEYIIREGLKKTVNWEELNCKIVGEAQNGMEAMELVKHYEPNIVITDIKMPGLSGIELTELILNKYPYTKIIFLTGYNDFSFARQAIKLGAFDFILKPTDINELESILRKAQQSIDVDKDALATSIRNRELIEKSIPILREKFLNDLISDYIDESVLQRRMEFFDLYLHKFIVMTIDFSSQKNSDMISEEDQFIDIYYVKYMLEEILTRCQIQAYIFNHQHYLVTICSFQSEPDEECVQAVLSIAEEIRYKVDQESSFSINCGISNVHQKLLNVKRAYQESKVSLDRTFYTGWNTVIQYGDLHQHDEQLQCEFIDINGVIRAFETHDWLKLDKELILLEGCMYRLKKEEAIDLAIEVLISIYNTYNRNWASPDKRLLLRDLPYEVLFDISTISELLKLVSGKIKEVINKVDSIHHLHTRKVISNCVEFINKHYMKQIGLNDLAEEVYMSRWYLSKLFKKEMEVTFTEYLLNTRINAAKKILVNEPSLKVYEVASNTGFLDVRYFSQNFKKVVGQTPTDFRETHY